MKFILISLALLFMLAIGYFSLRNYIKDFTGGIFTSARTCTNTPSNLINVKNFQCCYVGSDVTPFRYVEELDVVVGPQATYYPDACSSFCLGGIYNLDKMTCASGNSDKFSECVKLTKPINCIGSAMPVAVSGITQFYVSSATSAACPCSGGCNGISDCI